MRGRVGFEKDMSGSDFPKNACRRAIAGMICDLAFFVQNYFGEFRTNRTETELAIEPERTRLDALFIVEADLVRVNRKDSNAKILPEEA